MTTPTSDSPAQLEPTPLGMEDLVIAGVELDESQARIALFDVPDRPGYAATVFRAIAEAGVFVDMIVQNVGQRRRFAALVHRPARRRRAGRRRPSRAAGIERGLGRAGPGQALGHRRRHAHAHRRRHPDVRAHSPSAGSIST